MIELNGISKSFPGVQALDDVDLKIEKKKVHVLLGENGAGKSTLMKIVYGMYFPEKGSILLDGKPVSLKNTHEAIDLGIGMVHQHFMLIDDFNGYENVVLGFEPKQNLSFDRKEMVDSVDSLVAATNIKIDLSRKVKDMTVGEKQKIEILKLLYRKSELLVLDEPTAVLTPNEVVELFNMIKILKEQGKGIILITHKLHEALDVADVISVLRDGKKVADDLDPETFSKDEIARLMVGREVSLYTRCPAKRTGNSRFIVENITTDEKAGCSLNNLSFEVKEGEILGIAGVDGNGQTELVDVIAGLRKSVKRKIKIYEKSVPENTKEILESGIGFIHEDRNHNGLVSDMSVCENIVLGYHRRKSLKTRILLSMRNIRENAKKLISQFGIKTQSEHTLAGYLSGGNQQKIIIARVFSNNPDVAIVSQPTRGVDVGAMEYIHESILSFRDDGNAVLLISADLDEVKCLSDRLLIMYKGEIVAEGKPEDFSDTQLGLYMTGAKGAETERMMS